MRQPERAGRKKEDGGFRRRRADAILTEASSGAVLFEKNADELRAPSSMMKLVPPRWCSTPSSRATSKLTDEYRISENAWRRAARQRRLDHVRSPQQQGLGGRTPARRDHPERQRRLYRAAEGMAGNERIFAADFMTKRARELGLMKSTFANSNGLPDPATR